MVIEVASIGRQKIFRITQGRGAIIPGQKKGENRARLIGITFKMNKKL